MEDDDKPLPHDDKAWDDLSEFFADSNAAVPQSPPNKKGERFSNRYTKYKDDVFVERIMAGETVTSINESIGRHPCSGAPKNQYYKDRLAARQKKLINKHKVTAERVIAEIAKVAFLDPRAFFDEEGKPIPINMLDDDAAAAIAGMEVHKLGKDQGWAEVIKYKLADKLKALDQLGRNLNIYKDDNDSEINVNMGGISDNERARRVAFILAEAMQAKAKPEEGE